MSGKLEIGTRIRMITDHYGKDKLGNEGIVKKFIYEDAFKVVVVEFDNYVFEFLEDDIDYSFEIVGEAELKEHDLKVGMHVLNADGEQGEITSVYNGNVRVVFEKMNNGKRVRKVSNFSINTQGKTWFLCNEQEKNTNLSEEEIDILIDLALDWKDEKWFNELVQRKEALEDAKK